MLLDEVDKVSSYIAGVRPLDALLNLLEPTTARCFVDTYVGLPLRAEGVQWLMTANSTAALPAPLLDRVVVVEMPPLGPAGTRDALRRMLAELQAEHGLPAAALGDAALDRLQRAGMRQARRTLSLALGPALAAGRAAPDAADIAGASALLDRPARRRRAPPTPKRGPVGFVHFPSGPSREAARSEAPQPRRRGTGAEVDHRAGASRQAGRAPTDADAAPDWRPTRGETRHRVRARARTTRRATTSGIVARRGPTAQAGGPGGSNGEGC